MHRTHKLNKQQVQETQRAICLYENVSVHRTDKLNKQQVQETQQQYAYLSATCL